MSSILKDTYKSAKTKIKKRLDEIDFILNSNPLSDICQLRIDSKPLLLRIQKSKRPSDDDLLQLKKIAKKEKELFELAEKGQDTISLIDEKVKLESELYELHSKARWMEGKL